MAAGRVMLPLPHFYYSLKGIYRSWQCLPQQAALVHILISGCLSSIHLKRPSYPTQQAQALPRAGHVRRLSCLVPPVFPNTAQAKHLIHFPDSSSGQICSRHESAQFLLANRNFSTIFLQVFYFSCHRHIVLEFSLSFLYFSVTS